jgi:hypothetical protein
MSDESTPQDDMELAKALMQQQMDLMLGSMQQMEALVADTLGQLDVRLQQMSARVSALQQSKDDTKPA